ncbi:hypothetical protein DFH06DRAFT_1140347 [Mycena polygramma]|nr:hypothetical protein DFH06DRAFT_1140347 [Mycena polygramma]
MSGLDQLHHTGMVKADIQVRSKVWEVSQSPDLYLYLRVPLMVWRPPSDLAAAFPPWEVEERPLVLSYSTDGTRILSIEKESRSIILDDSNVTKRATATYKGKDKEVAPTWDVGEDLSATLRDDSSVQPGVVLKSAREEPSSLNVTGFSSSDPNASVLFHVLSIPFKDTDQSLFGDQSSRPVLTTLKVPSTHGSSPEPFVPNSAAKPTQTYGIMGRVLEPSVEGRMSGNDSFGSFADAHRGQKSTQ